jgi:hypothetical protein
MRKFVVALVSVLVFSTVVFAQPRSRRYLYPAQPLPTQKVFDPVYGYMESEPKLKVEPKVQPKRFFDPVFGYMESEPIQPKVQSNSRYYFDPVFGYMEKILINPKR